MSAGGGNVAPVTDPQALADLRIEYETQGLDRSMLSDDPIEQFDRWMQAAIDGGLSQPNTMVLATADAHGRPSARAVLLKGFDARGFVLYTNLESRKGRELSANPQASLCFVWLELHRQVRIEGSIEMVDAADSDAYFSSRPREAQIASAASPQSRPVASRGALEALFGELERQSADGVVRPDEWGGVRVVPHTIEFWQGRPHRFHDRLVYRSTDDGWEIERLAP